MHRSAVVLLLSLACAGRAAGGTATTMAAVDTMNMIATLKNGSALFVLSKLDNVAGEPAITSDRPCTSGRAINSVRDSIMLSADGSVRRTYYSERTSNGALQGEPITAVSTGWWAVSPSTNSLVFNSAFYGTGTTLELHMHYTTGQDAGTTYLRQYSTSNLATLAAAGSSCPGGGSDAREATYTYTRR